MTLGFCPFVYFIVGDSSFGLVFPIDSNMATKSLVGASDAIPISGVWELVASLLERAIWGGLLETDNGVCFVACCMKVDLETASRAATWLGDGSLLTDCWLSGKSLPATRRLPIWFASVIPGYLLIALLLTCLWTALAPGCFEKLLFSLPAALAAAKAPLVPL